MELLPKLESYIRSLDSIDIAVDRRLKLDLLITYIQQKSNDNSPINLNFICTHNSRRSHLAQVWAQTLGYYFGVASLRAYSGGTESTALNPMIVHSLEKQGFISSKIADCSNPIYSIKYSQNHHPIIGFSKKYDNPFNPSSDFAAVMTCSDADENCPLVTGAEQRITLTYEDPKLFDHTDLQERKYLERSQQIASELYYVFKSCLVP